jgi:rhodanese-related sulfurtransferase
MRLLYTFNVTLLILSTFFTACSQTAKPSQGKVALVSPTEFSQKLESMKETRILLDVRTPGEYKKGHLENALPIDIFRDDFAEVIKTLDSTKPIFVYCAAGGRSEEASEMLLKLGFKTIYDLDGGITAWRKQNLPVSLAP